MPGRSVPAAVPFALWIVGTLPHRAAVAVFVAIAASIAGPGLACILKRMNQPLSYRLRRDTAGTFSTFGHFHK